MTNLLGHAPTPPSTAPATPRPVRVEIQALRAVAVLLVVLYHLWPLRLPGGYIGVDVFFVISGFLITSHLLSEVGRTGTVSLRRFWARRIRRLLPAASITLVASAIAMFLVVPPSLWERTAREITASALYFQNWALALNSIDYLGAEGSKTLVNHFWSLSVEEQFYIVWPILIVLTLLVTKRFAARKALLVVLAIVFAASLVFSITETASNPSIAYFHTFTRAWEFAAGGLLAFIPAAALSDVRSRLGITLNAVAAYAGWALVFLTGYFYTEATPFPSFYALLPVVGTVLIIGAGKPDRGFSVNRISGFWPLRQLGDLSYAIYLWHWPLIVVVPYITLHDLSTWEKLGILVVAIGLAALSRTFIEQPVQRSTFLSARPWRSYAFAIVTALVVIGVTTASISSVPTTEPTKASQEELEKPCFGASAIVNIDSCADPFTVPTDLNTVALMNDRGSLGMNCSSPEIEVVQCEFGDTTDPEHTIAVIGNSHAGHLIGALDQYGKTHAWKIILMRHTGCSGAITSAVVPGTVDVCTDWTKNVQKEILTRPEIDTVVFGTNRDSLHYFTRGSLNAEQDVTLRAAVLENLDGYADAGKAVIVFGDVPGNFTDPVPECVFLNRDDYDPCATPRGRKESKGEVNYIAEAAQASDGRIGYHDLRDYFCTGSKCHVVIGGEVAYIDEHHMSDTFSRSLAPYLGPVIAERIELAAAGK